jgi:hypothetical protein
MSLRGEIARPEPIEASPAPIRSRHRPRAARFARRLSLARTVRLACSVGVAWTIAHSCALAQAQPSTDSLSVTGDGTTLTGTNGGGGGSVAWLHDFDPSTVSYLGAEHQVLANANWTFGSLNVTRGFGPDNERLNAYADIHEGAGHDALRSFDYHIEAGGLIATFDRRLGVTLEDRRIDVENVHGNLPKAGLSYLWNPHFMTSVSYQYSVTGNLATRISAARLDYFSAAFNVFGGGAYGPTLPIVFDLPTGLVAERRRQKEGFVGASKPLPKWHSDVTLVADYVDLSGVKRAVFTLTYVFHIPR